VVDRLFCYILGAKLEVTGSHCCRALISVVEDLFEIDFSVLLLKILVGLLGYVALITRSSDYS